MKNQEKKIDARKQDEAITNGILAVFSLSLILLLAVMFISRYMNSFTSYDSALAFCTVASIALSVIGAGLVITALTKRKNRESDPWYKRFLMSGCFTLIAALVFLYIWLYTYDAFGVLYAAIPISAFLYMIFNIYQREFFYQTVVVGCAAGTLYAFSRWLHHTPWAPVVHIAYILAITLLLAAVPVLLALKKRKGVLFGRKLLSANANYNIMFITLGLMLAVIVAVLLIGSGVAFWSMIGVFGYLFVLAVYYTIKMM